MPGGRAGLLPRAGGYPSALRNFNDIQQQIQQRSQLISNLQRQQQLNTNSRVPSPPILSTGLANVGLNRTPYTPAGRLTGSLIPALGSGAYARAPSGGLSYAPPSFTVSDGGSLLSGQATPYRSLPP